MFNELEFIISADTKNLESTIDSAVKRLGKNLGSISQGSKVDWNHLLNLKGLSSINWMSVMNTMFTPAKIIEFMAAFAALGLTTALSIGQVQTTSIGGGAGATTPGSSGFSAQNQSAMTSFAVGNAGELSTSPQNIISAQAAAQKVLQGTVSQNDLLTKSQQLVTSALETTNLGFNGAAGSLSSFNDTITQAGSVMTTYSGTANDVTGTMNDLVTGTQNSKVSYDEFTSTIAANGNNLSAAGVPLKTATSDLAGFYSGLGMTGSAAETAFGQIASAMAGTLPSNAPILSVPGIFQAIKDKSPAEAIKDIGDYLASLSPTNAQNVGAAMGLTQSNVTALVTSAKSNFSSFDAVVSNSANNVINLSNSWASGESELQKLQGVFYSLEGELGTAFLSALPGIESFFDKLLNMFRPLTPLWDTVKDNISSLNPVLIFLEMDFKAMAIDVVFAITLVIAAILLILLTIETVAKWLEGPAEIMFKNAINNYSGFFSTLGKNIKNIFDDAKNDIINAFQDAFKWVENAINDVSGFFGTLGTNIKNTFNNIQNDIQNAFQDAFKWVENFVQQEIKTILGFFDNIGGDIKNDILKGISDLPGGAEIEKLLG